MELDTEKVMKFMKLYGWSGAELARKMKRDRQWIHYVLKPGQNLTFKTVNDLAKALDVDPRDLIQ